MCDFNAQPPDGAKKDFIKVNGLKNLIKGNTCFKGQGSSIDLILTNRSFSFRNSNLYETDHPHLIYFMLKSIFSNIKPKLVVTYRDYKKLFF